MEATFDKKYGADARIELPNLIIVPGGSTEQIFDMMTKLVDGNPDNEYLFVLDSVGMLAANAVEDKDLNSHNIGSNAKKLNECIVRLVGKQGNLRNCTLLAINHVHQQIGVMTRFPVWITTGGERLKYACSVRLDVANIEKYKSPTGADLGFKMKVKVVKNKVGAPNAVVELSYYYKTGFDVSGELFEEGYRLGLITKAETGIKWFYNGETFTGKPKVQAYILNEPGIKEQLAQQISDYYNNPENEDAKSFGIVLEDDEHILTTVVGKEDDTSSFVEAYDISAEEQNEFYNTDESIVVLDEESEEEENDSK